MAKRAKYTRVKHEGPVIPDPDLPDGVYIDAATMTVLELSFPVLDGSEYSQSEWELLTAWVEYCHDQAYKGNVFRFTPGGMLGALERHSELEELEKEAATQSPEWPF